MVRCNDPGAVQHGAGLLPRPRGKAGWQPQPAVRGAAWRAPKRQPGHIRAPSPVHRRKVPGRGNDRRAERRGGPCPPWRSTAVPPGPASRRRKPLAGAGPSVHAIRFSSWQRSLGVTLTLPGPAVKRWLPKRELARFGVSWLGPGCGRIRATPGHPDLLDKQRHPPTGVT